MDEAGWKEASKHRGEMDEIGWKKELKEGWRKNRMKQDVITEIEGRIEGKMDETGWKKG
jgi:hypothetical protein